MTKLSTAFSRKQAGEGLSSVGIYERIWKFVMTQGHGMSAESDDQYLYFRDTQEVVGSLSGVGGVTTPARGNSM